MKLGNWDPDAAIKGIIQKAQAEANASLALDDYGDAKRCLSDGVRDLRDLKRQVTDAERSVRESYQDARLKTRQAGTTVGLFVGSKTRGAMARGRAMEGRNISARQAQALRPYAIVKSEIDRAIAALDRAKAQVTDQAADAKLAGTAVKARPAVSRDVPPPPGAVTAPPPAPPAWNPDPTGRHEHRYWDGARWTEHVADNGVAAVDPMP
ncbi:MAG: hypothetical protein JWP19_1404 [Rhodoglobus sp.]|nr:hypothetical protein [Rhodoglobus sp.]